MNLKQTVLASSMVAVFALPSFNAQASIYVGKAIGNANYSAKLAVEQPNENNGNLHNTQHRLNVAFPVIPGYSTSPVNRLFYRVTLKGGVKFNATPQMLCGTVGNSLVLANTQVIGTTAINATTVNFLITSNVTMRQDAKSAMCVLSFKATELPYKVSDKTEQIISAVLQYKDALDTKSAAYVGSLISFVQSNKVAITGAKGGLVPNAVLEVAESSKKFVPITNVTTQTTAYIGTVSFKSANLGSGVTAGLSRTGAIVRANRIITTATITVVGTPLIGAKGIYVRSNPTNTCDGGADVSNGVVTPVGDTVTIRLSGTSNVDYLDQTIPKDVQLCLVLDGNTSIDGGILTVSVGGTPATGGWSPIFGDAVEVYEVKKNGSSFRVLNIPNPANGDKPFIRLYNPSTNPVKARGIFIGQDGAQIGTPQILETVPAGAVRIIDSAKLQALFGVTTWAGRARLIVEAESADFSVQATIRAPSGILTNMSSETVSE